MPTLDSNIIGKSSHVNLVSEPLTTNRGVDGGDTPAVFSIDWLSFTIWVDYQAACILLDSLGLLEGLDYSGHGAKGFQYLYVGLDGLQLKVSTSGYCHIVMPGKVCQKLRPEQFVDVFDYAINSDTKIQVTRLDLALDGRYFGVGDVWRAIKEDRVKTYVKRENMLHYEDAAKSGETVQIGSRQSLQLIRFYKKTIEGHAVFGDEPFTRTELELHHERAQVSFALLVQLPIDQWGQTSAGFLAGFIEFEDGWWERFLNGAVSCWVRLKQHVPSIERAQAWIETQVLPSLAVVAFALSKGVDKNGEISFNLLKTLERMVLEGREKWTNKHRAMLRAYRAGRSTDYAVFDF